MKARTPLPQCSFMDLVNGQYPPPPKNTAVATGDHDHEIALLVGQASGAKENQQWPNELLKNLSPGYTSPIPKLHRFHVFTYANVLHVEFAALFPLDTARWIVDHPWSSLDRHIVSINCVYPVPAIESPLLSGHGCDSVGICFPQSISGQLRPLLAEVATQLPAGWALVSAEKPLQDGQEFPEAYAEILFPPARSGGDPPLAGAELPDTPPDPYSVALQLEQIALRHDVAGRIYYRNAANTIEETLIRVP